MQQILFNTSAQPKPKTGKGSGKPRGPYKPRKMRVIPVSMYQKLDELRFQIALLIDPALIFRHCESFKKDYRFFNLWCEKYIAGSFEYEGEIFEGENFKIIQAELKGTEALKIKENLAIHRRLISYTYQGYTIDEAALLLQPLILKFKNQEIIFSDVDNSIKEIVWQKQPRGRK